MAEEATEKLADPQMVASGQGYRRRKPTTEEIVEAVAYRNRSGKPLTDKQMADGLAWLIGIDLSR